MSIMDNFEPKNSMDRYFSRTVKHIHRVQNNMAFLVTRYRGCRIDGFIFDNETCRQLMWNVMKHDQSKFSLIQFEPYVALTEYYHQRRVLKNKSYEYTPEIKIRVDQAVDDHYCVENHHPERMKGKPGKMPLVDLVEIICDLQSMAQEFNEGSCRGYFEDKWVGEHAEYYNDIAEWEFAKWFMRNIITLFEKS